MPPGNHRRVYISPGPILTILRIDRVGPCGRDGHTDLARAGFWEGNLPEMEDIGTAKGVIHDSTHRGYVPFFVVKWARESGKRPGRCAPSSLSFPLLSHLQVCLLQCHLTRLVAVQMHSFSF